MQPSVSPLPQPDPAQAPPTWMLPAPARLSAIDSDPGDFSEPQLNEL